MMIGCGEIVQVKMCCRLQRFCYNFDLTVDTDRITISLQSACLQMLSAQNVASSCRDHCAQDPQCFAMKTLQQSSEHAICSKQLSPSRADSGSVSGCTWSESIQLHLFTQADPLADAVLLIVVCESESALCHTARAHGTRSVPHQWRVDWRIKQLMRLWHLCPPAEGSPLPSLASSGGAIHAAGSD